VNHTRSRLLALLLAALLPLVGLASVLVVTVAQQERRAIEDDTRRRVARVVELVEREVGGHLRVVEALAQSTHLDHGDLAAFHEEARRVRDAQPGWHTMTLADPQGNLLLNLRQRPGAALGTVVDPASFAEIARTGRPVVGGINPPGPENWLQLMPIRVPVMRDGAMRYVLTAVLTPTGIGAVVGSADVPAEWVGIVADREGRIVARTRDAERYIGRTVNEFTLNAIRSGQGEGFYAGRTLDGIDVNAFFRLSPLTGWSVHFGIPVAAFEVARSRSVLVAALGAAGSVLLAGVLAWLVLRDIAAQRRAGAALRQAQKMEAIGQLTGGIAHDFNNLLTIVSGSVSLVLPTVQDGKTRRRLELAMQAAERGAALTRQLLTFARRAVLRSEVIALPAHLEAVHDLLAGALRRDIALRIEAPPGLWPVDVDPEQLDLALLNAAVNARDAMPTGGVFRIALRNAELPRDGDGDGDGEGRQPHLSGDFVRVDLIDTGAGMPPEAVEHAFEPFFTTKEAGKGTGLGLSQVYGFAAQSGGGVALDSRLGAGTTLTLFLPRARRAAAPEAVDAAPPATGAAPCSVLVVDDEAAVAETAAALLDRLGYRTAVADRADAALALLDGGHRFDVVVSDVVMPGGMSGVQLAQEIARRHPRLPVLLTTGYAAELQDGVVPAHRILRKPYHAATLDDAIRACLGAAEKTAA